jgi:Flp pilus assembly protein TadD
MMLAALGLRIVILVDYVAHNPLAGTPINDAAAYWQWSARVAGGKLVEDAPFFSAPLYPYLLGALRALGGGLIAVYIIQMLLDLVTGVVLAVTVRERFTPGTGLVAASLYWLLLAPASFSLRVLTCSLQLLLLACAYRQLVRVQARPILSRRIGLGAVLGLLCLSYPPAMMLTVLVVPWLFWQSGRRLADAGRALVPLGMAAVVIAPATIHNWYASRGDLFLIQSVTGVNLRQGNQPESTGGFTPIPGTSPNRENMFPDLARQYEESTGQPVRWSAIDRRYRDEVIRFWLADPLRTARLVVTKLYWFLSARNYGDIYLPAVEITEGLSRGLRLAPLRVAWLMGPALVGLVLLLRRPIRYGPEWLPFLISLITVAVFWYNPRYRLPAVPAIVIVTAWLVVRAADWRTHWRLTAATVLAVAASLMLGVVNRAVSFDVPNAPALSLPVAGVLEKQGRLAEAVEQWRKAADLNPQNPDVREHLGDVLQKSGRTDEALAVYERVWALSPSPGVVGKLVQILVAAKRPDDAERVLEQALDQQPDQATLLAMLARLRQAQGQLDVAEELYGRAAALAPDDVTVRSAYGTLLMSRQRWAQAQVEFAAVAELSPDDFDAQNNLGVIWGELGDFDRARACFVRAAEIRPNDAGALFAVGVVDMRAGRLDDAEQFFRRALTLRPDDERYRAALDHVQQLRKQRGTSTQPTP